MTNAIPNYAAWSRDDLLNETSKLAYRIAELETSSPPSEGWAERQRVQRAMAQAKYAAATVALMRLAEPFDKGALARRDVRIAELISDRDRYLAVALGTEFIQRHDAEAVSAVR